MQSIESEVQVSVHPKPACRVELAVKASPLLIQRARKEAIKAVNKEVSLPGFRKGKAPEERIARTYPKEVEKQARQELADLAFAEARKTSHVPPLLNNNASVSFDMKSLSEEGAELLFSFETEPKVPSVDPNLFKTGEVARPEVGEKEIEEAIRQAQFFHAEWKLVSDRPIQDGDYIIIDLDLLEGEEPQRVFHHTRFEVSSERMADWMKRLVLGAKNGDVLEGVSEADAAASEEEKKEFAPKKVRLSILKVEEATLPALDDAFAKKLGAEDVAMLRQSISQMLSAQAEQKVQSALREQVNAFLINQYPFELPQSLIDAEKKHRLERMRQSDDLLKKWKRLSEEGKKDFTKKLTEEAEGAVRLFYLSRQIIRDAQITISHSEVQREAASLLQQQGHHPQEINIDEMSNDLIAHSLSRVMLAKAQAWILSHKLAS